MRIAVIGAGVIGVTTAYELALDGHEVTVFERHGTAAEEASFANGGLMLPGTPNLLNQSSGWQTLLPPGSPTGGLYPGAWPAASTWSWIWQRHRALRSPAQQTLQATQFQLTRLSRARLEWITDRHQLAYDRCNGALLLWRQERDATVARAALPILREWGATASEVDAQRARQLEPSINPETSLYGALELPMALSANTRQFTLQLKNLAVALGCHFSFGRPVTQLSSTGPAALVSVAGGTEPQRFDHAVVCAGAASQALLRPLGLALPLRALYGHSISAAIREPLDAPQSSVIDVRQQVLITRQGQRIRVSGGASLSNSRDRRSSTELQRLYRVLMDWFPGAARLGGPTGSVQEWRGAQTCVPDGAPVLGESKAHRIWLNLGHGASGWAMACGSARALADRLQGREAALDLTPLSASRLLA